ncbi:MAG: 16S rRNA (uracil(1498)-N(3))-methyltransferase [Thiohalocapsa sp.]
MTARTPRIPRIYTPQPLGVGDRVTLEAGASAHLAQVLRLQPGDAVVLFNGDGHDCRGHIETSRRDAVRARIERRGPQEAAPSLPICLALGISKGERMDFSLQKAVELGVSAIVPLFTERSVVRLRDERLARRIRHWQGVVVSACEQSGRSRLPALADPLGLQAWLDTAPAGGLLLDPRGDLPLPDAMPPSAEGLTLLVGPEGGLSPQERRAALAAGFRGVRLGPRTLRAETAPLAAIAAIQGLWGDFRL